MSRPAGTPDAPRPRALLLDFYGTLVHSPGFTLADGIAVLGRSLRESGIAIADGDFERAYREAVLPYLEVMRTGIETHNTSWVADTLTALGRPSSPADPEVVAAVRAYFETYAAAIEPLPGAEESLARLSPAIPCVLVSNFTDALPVRSSLARLRWGPFFRAVLISADLGIRKPHPGIFERAAREAGCAPAEALFVGDDLDEDVGGAHAAGIPAVLISRSMGSPLRALARPSPGPPPEPEWTIGQFRELPALLAMR